MIRCVKKLENSILSLCFIGLLSVPVAADKIDLPASIATPPLLAKYRSQNWALPDDMATWDLATKTRQLKAGDRLFREINAAAQKGRIVFNVPPGNYRITTKTLSGIHNMVINGNGANLFIDRVTGNINLKNCSSLKLKNFTVDYDPLPFIQGEIFKVNDTDNTIEMLIHPGFDKNLKLFMRGDPNSIVALFDPLTKKLKQDFLKRRLIPNSMRQISPFLIRFKLTEGFEGMTLSQMNYKRGDYIVLPSRRVPLFWLRDCKDITFDEVSIYSACGMAFREHNCNNTVYKRIKIIPRPGTKRLLSICADAFHGINSRNVSITNCQVESSGDDVFNFHSYYSVVLQQKNPRTIIISETCRGMELNKLNLSGVDVVFSDSKTGKIIAKSKIKTVKNIPQSPKIKKLICSLPPAIYAVSGKLNTYSHQIEINLQNPVFILAGTLVNFPKYDGYGFTIRNNRFFNIRSRGIIVQSGNGIIANNRFEWMTHCPISIGPIAAHMAPTAFPESGGCDNIIIKNNVMIDTSFGKTTRIATHPQKGAISIFGLNRTRNPLQRGNYSNHNITITQNKIIRCGLSAIYALYVDGLTIDSNEIINSQTFDAIGHLNNFPAPDYAIMIGAANNIEILNNKISLSHLSKGILKIIGCVDLKTLKTDIKPLDPVFIISKLENK